MIPVPFAGHLGYDAVFIATYAGWLLFEIVTGRSRKSSDPKRGRDRGSYYFLLGMIWVGSGFGFAAAFGLQRAAIPWHRTEIFFAGIALMWVGIAFRYYAMRVLGRYFTFQVDVRAGQTVVEAGPYRYIRHPSYSGALITILGLGLVLGNWASVVAMLACVGIGYAYRVRVEEAALVAALGQPYREYMRRTRRLVPFVL
ncbi:MAG: isoprenylcysteine carboxylmethyltransferase family protein [Candidatus Acidiferrales bacterium]